MVASGLRKPSIFISHSHNDNDLGIKLLTDLRRIIGDDDAVWYDSEGGLNAGDHWRMEIDQQLAKRNVFILLFSRSSNRSHWVKYETDAAIYRATIKKMKLIVVLCDDCTPPQNLQIRYHLTRCTSQEEYKVSLKSIVRSLGLGEEPENPKEKMILALNKQIRFAFDDKDWPNVIEYANLLTERFPESFLYDAYKMKSFALLHIKQVKQSVAALNETISLVSSDEQYIQLLDEYTLNLIEKEEWLGVKECSEQALLTMPTDTIWLERKELACNKLGLVSQNASSFVAISAGREIPQKEESILYSSVVGDTTSQKSSSTFNDIETGPITTNFQISYSPSTTTLLNNFTEKRVPHRQLKQMLGNKASLITFIINVFIISLFLSTFIHELWPLVDERMALYTTGLVLVLLFLCGWLTPHDWIAFALFVLFGILWGIDGYYIGSHIVDWLHMSNDVSNISVDIPYILAGGTALSGWCLHHDLFRGDKV